MSKITAEHLARSAIVYVRQSTLLQVERKMILQLRNEQVINDDVLRRIQRDIDLAEARLQQEEQ